MPRKKKVVESADLGLYSGSAVVEQEVRKFQTGDRVRLLGEPRGFKVEGKIINYNLVTHAYRVNGISTQYSPKGVILTSSPISKILSADRLELIKDPT